MFWFASIHCTRCLHYTHTLHIFGCKLKSDLQLEYITIAPKTFPGSFPGIVGIAFPERLPRVVFVTVVLERWDNFQTDFLERWVVFLTVLKLWSLVCPNCLPTTMCLGLLFFLEERWSRCTNCLPTTTGLCLDCLPKCGSCSYLLRKAGLFPDCLLRRGSFYCLPRTVVVVLSS